MADRSDSLKLYENKPQEVTTADILRRYGPEPDERGMLLPISRTGGKLSLDWPLAIYEPYQAIKRLVTRPVAPGYLSSSGDRGPIEDSFNAAAAVAAPSLGLNYAGMAPKNAVGIFGGRLAKTADQAALARAEEMAAKGADRRAIWDETGWFQGKDGKWRFEIDDSKMGHQVKPTDWIAKREPGQPWMAPNVETAANKAMESLSPHAPLRMKRLFMHDEAQRAYPVGFSGTPDWQHQGIMSIPVKLIKGEGPAALYAGDYIGLHQSLPPGTAKSAALHEMQHAVQHREGFARGDSPTHYPVSRLKDEAIKPLDEQIQTLMQEYPEAAEAYRARNRLQATLRGKEWSQADMAAMDALEEKLFSLPGGKNLDRLDWERQSLWYQPEDYWKGVATNRYERAAGEVEARNVQKRMNMTPQERRATPPWETQDVPDTQQILRMYGKDEE